ncbi:MAG: hypothetical protein LBT40_03935 [Deltaproteobacteria bacterium]|jgi:signal transduction histidine kinase/PAS domain-containing protein|nr:hypothetical protein [Deltaproteobacteria bacterium]
MTSAGNESSKEIPPEESGEIPAQVHGEIPAEVPCEFHAKVPGENPAEGHGVNPAKAPCEIRAKKDGKSPSEGPGNTPGENAGESGFGRTNLLLVGIVLLLAAAAWSAAAFMIVSGRDSELIDMSYLQKGDALIRSLTSPEHSAWTRTLTSRQSLQGAALEYREFASMANASYIVLTDLSGRVHISSSPGTFGTGDFPGLAPPGDFRPQEAKSFVSDAGGTRTLWIYRPITLETGPTASGAPGRAVYYLLTGFDMAALDEQKASSASWYFKAISLTGLVIFILSAAAILSYLLRIERRRARYAESRAETIIGCLSSGLFITDPDGIVLQASAEALRISGLGKDAVIGRSLDDLVLSVRELAGGGPDAASSPPDSGPAPDEDLRGGPPDSGPAPDEWLRGGPPDSGPAPDEDLRGGPPDGGPAPDEWLRGGPPDGGPAPDDDLRGGPPDGGPAPDKWLREGPPDSGPAPDEDLRGSPPDSGPDEGLRGGPPDSGPAPDEGLQDGPPARLEGAQVDDLRPGAGSAEHERAARLRLLEDDFIDAELVMSFAGGGAREAVVSVSTGTFDGRDGLKAGRLVLMANIRDKEERRRESAERDLLATLGLMAKRLTHAINNPLTAIRGSTQHVISMVAEGKMDPKLFVDKLGTVLTSVDRLKSTSTSVLDFGREARPNLEAVNAALLLTDLEDLHADNEERAGIAFDVTLPPLPVAVMADEAMFSEVLQNLFENALQAVRGNPPERPGRVEAALSGSSLTGAVITFADNGPGFSGARLSRPFQPYSTTRVNGNGLGLPIVKKLVAAHGGTVTLSNRTGAGGEIAGAQITIALPGVSPEAAKKVVEEAMKGG